MKTVQLMNGVIYSSCKTVKEIYEPIMWISGLKQSVMTATS